jgi:uncharacterized Zn-binding protein involved in type VI secretion
MPKAHLHGDPRTCGATTIVTGQTTVYVDGKLWAVEGDLNTHGGGALIATGDPVQINGKKVIVHTPDNASPDNEDHADPATAAGSGTTNAYG